MLFFVDESWQTINGEQIAALGGIALAREEYNSFCSAVYRIKGDCLGARELTDCEIKGQHAFSKAAFKRERLHGDSYWLAAIRRMFDALVQRGGRTFVIWTRNPTTLTLRHHHTTSVSQAYKQLFFDMKRLLEGEAPDRLGIINFDQRELRQDEASACAVQNYFVRTLGGWRERFIQVPTFTASTSSPGLQAADVVAYLGAHQAHPGARPDSVPTETLFGSSDTPSS